MSTPTLPGSPILNTQIQTYKSSDQMIRSGSLGKQDGELIGFDIIQKDLGLVNVMDFGAKGDGIADDTIGIQAAINKAYDNGGGVVYFPNGIYRLAGALKTSGVGIGNPNSQLYIKNTSTLFSTIKLLGQTPPAQVAGVLGSYDVNTGGVVLFSDINGSGTRPSIFSTVGSAGGGSFNGVEVYIENIEFRVKANIDADGPTMGCLNLSNCINVTVKDVFCGLDTSTNNAVYPTADTFGVYAPRTNGGGGMFHHVSVTGFKYGFIFSEHVVGDQLFAVGCEYAYVMANGYHTCNLNRVASSWCVFPLSAGIAIFNPLGFPSANVRIAQLNIEWQADTYGDWFDSGFTINDEDNNLLGEVEYDMIEREVGRNNSGFSKNGGDNIVCSPFGGPKTLKNLILTQVIGDRAVFDKMIVPAIPAVPVIGDLDGTIILNEGATNNYSFGLDVDDGSGKYPVYFKTGQNNGGGFNFYKGTALVAQILSNGDFIATGNMSEVVPEYADNSAAIAGGLSIGKHYRTGDLLKIVH